MFGLKSKKKKCRDSMKCLIDAEAAHYKKEAKEATKKLLELFEKQKLKVA